MSDADIGRLMQAAPRYGIELLGREALIQPKMTVAIVPPETLDVFGVSLQVLAEPGAGRDGVSIMREVSPPVLSCRCTAIPIASYF
jgi:hypothetical protein